MDGHQVMTAGDAAAWGEIFVTATGNLNVFREEHFRVMADGAVLANSGHFDAELEISALARLAEGHVREVRDNVREYDLGEKRLYLLAEGRLVNLGAAEGHPAAVMDMSFAGQALSAEFVAANHEHLTNEVHVVPAEIDEQIARLKLESRGIFIEDMTPEQVAYYHSWKQGT
jgi:adenosylhomocysteinase